MKSSAATLVLVFCLAAISLQAQTPPPATQEPDYEVLRTSTNLVAVPVIVKNLKGAYIPNLRREDFRIYEDGVEQDVSNFETINANFTIVLMLDVSDSTRMKLVDIQSAAIAFLDQLRPNDRALIVADNRL